MEIQKVSTDRQTDRHSSPQEYCQVIFGLYVICQGVCCGIFGMCDMDLCHVSRNLVLG